MSLSNVEPVGEDEASSILSLFQTIQAVGGVMGKPKKRPSSPDVATSGMDGPISVGAASPTNSMIEAYAKERRLDPHAADRDSAVQTVPGVAAGQEATSAISGVAKDGGLRHEGAMLRRKEDRADG